LENLFFIVIKAREFDAEVPPIDEDSGSNRLDDEALAEARRIHDQKETDYLEEGLLQLRYSLEDFEIGHL
jgi:hypothetical protein